jgi:2-polyprenyl-3-methyl-5-hydroxy-6-metoxy-1,4-benzoquinol methylase
MDPDEVYERYHETAKNGVLNELKEKSSRLDEKFSIIKKDVIPNLKKGSVLEIGCGLGYNVHLISRHGFKVEGSDISKVAIDQAKKSYPFQFFVLDIAKEPAKKRYDNIVLIGVMEHLFDYKKATFNLNRSLNMGGILILQLPCITWIKDRIKFLFGNADFLFRDDWHIRHFYPSYIKKLLEFYGFGNIKFKGYGKFKIASLCGTILVIATKVEEKKVFSQFQIRNT